MDQEIIKFIERLKKMFNAEISRALRTGDTKALQRAQEIRNQAYGFQIGLGMCMNLEKMKPYNDIINSWLNEIYD